MSKKILVRIFHVIFLFFLFLALSYTAYAQTNIAGDASLKLEPRFFEPGSTVTVSLDAYTMNTTGAEILWYVDGKELVASRNSRSIQVIVGDFGKTTEVSVRVKLFDGLSFTLKKSIPSTLVDLMIEPKTYVPPFYRGRALPSADTEARVIAIPHTGTNVDPSRFTYFWEYNGGTMFGGPILGRQSVDVAISPYTGSYVSVTVIDEAGNEIGGKTMSLNAINPELYFYEENPLRGLTEIALKDTLALIGDETTVHGEAYYLGRDLRPESMSFEWRINNEKVENVQQDPHIITLRRSGGAGNARVDLQAVTTAAIPRFVRSGFAITF